MFMSDGMLDDAVGPVRFVINSVRVPLLSGLFSIIGRIKLA
jgi:hypothetical protein